MLKKDSSLNRPIHKLALIDSCNRKINIGAIKLISIMGSTTIAISQEFHDWLRIQGKKGESYEEIIKNVIRNESLDEFERVDGSNRGSRPKKAHEKNAPKEKKISLSKKAKSHKHPRPAHHIKNIRRSKPKPAHHINKIRMPNPKSTERALKHKPEKLGKVAGHHAGREPAKPGIKQWKREKKLELERLKTEFELAKLSNDTVKLRELAASIERLRAELERSQ